MPIKPHPFILCCEKCGWRKTVRPQSDVVTECDLPDTCPKCGEEDIKEMPEDVLEVSFGVILERINLYK